jgi:hypothetical protein
VRHAVRGILLAVSDLPQQGFLQRLSLMNFCANDFHSGQTLWRSRQALRIQSVFVEQDFARALVFDEPGIA